MRQEYHKLVRDRIPGIIAQDGHAYAIETLAETEYRQALVAKLLEEAQELGAAFTAEAFVTELADVLEVIDALLKTKGIDRETVLAVQKERRQQRGSFEQRIKLLWVEYD